MVYNEKLAKRIREALSNVANVEEKKMFKGLAFMVNGKMCVNVSGENMMCRFDPALQDHVASKKGFEEMVMKGKMLKGYCYIHPEGIKSKKDFDYFISICLDFNERAKSSKSVKKSKNI